MIINEFSWSSQSVGYIQIRDVLPSSYFYPEERYSVVQDGFIPSSTPLPDVLLATLATSTLSTNDFDGTALPDFIPFSASDYYYTMWFGSWGNSFQLNSDISSINVIDGDVEVIEPSILALMCLGLIGLLGKTDENFNLKKQRIKNHIALFTLKKSKNLVGCK